MSNGGIIVSLALAATFITEGAYSQILPLGGAINVLNGYGHLAQSLKVMSTNMSERGIYRESIVPVFAIPLVYLSFTEDASVLSCLWLMFERYIVLTSML